jgi:hypothetical protein
MNNPPTSRFPPHDIKQQQQQQQQQQQPGFSAQTPIGELNFFCSLAIIKATKDLRRII